LLRRDVHGHAQTAVARATPLRALRARGAQDPVADRQDQARLLRDLEEVGGREQTELGVLPAQQRLAPTIRPRARS
jgi:hypothetical protein